MPSSAGADATIRPFRIRLPQADLGDLRERLARTRWPDELPGVGWAYGVPLGYLKQLAAYWVDGHDWRTHEANLNQFPQFTTAIDGQPIHFLHVRSPQPQVLPLVVTHGWPGSVVEFVNVIGPLTDPAAHGGDPADAFHLVIPSLPGYGLSGPTRQAGWTTNRVAGAWTELLAGLGYRRHGAQGGDWGAFVATELGRIDPDHIVGVHLNATTFGFIPLGPVDPDELATLTDAERARLERLNTSTAGPGNGYFEVQATRPQTLAYVLTDSPVGLLAWIVERFKEWTHAANVPEDAVDRDQLLTNVMLYRADQGGGVRRGLRHPPLRRARQPHRPLVGVRPRRPLRRHGSTRPAGQRRAQVLPPRSVMQAAWHRNPLEAERPYQAGAAGGHAVDRPYRDPRCRGKRCGHGHRRPSAAAVFPAGGSAGAPAGRGGEPARGVVSSYLTS